MRTSKKYRKNKTRKTRKTRIRRSTSRKIKGGMLRSIASLASAVRRRLPGSRSSRVAHDPDADIREYFYGIGDLGLSENHLTTRRINRSVIAFKRFEFSFDDYKVKDEIDMTIINNRYYDILSKELTRMDYVKIIEAYDILFEIYELKNGWTEEVMNKVSLASNKKNLLMVGFPINEVVGLTRSNFPTIETIRQHFIQRPFSRYSDMEPIIIQAYKDLAKDLPESTIEEDITLRIAINSSGSLPNARLPNARLPNARSPNARLPNARSPNARSPTHYTRSEMKSNDYYLKLLGFNDHDITRTKITSEQIRNNFLNTPLQTSSGTVDISKEDDVEDALKLLYKASQRTRNYFEEIAKEISTLIYTRRKTLRLVNVVDHRNPPPNTIHLGTIYDPSAYWSRNM